MNILVACEESQVVTTELRKLGHIAYSCDLKSTSGLYPQWHTIGDVRALLNGSCTFHTQDGQEHKIGERWDMIIAFPPCTHLAVSGARHFDKKREDGRQLEAIKFFAIILNADCDKIAVENPVNIIGSDYIKKHYPMYSNLPNCTQYIQPYEFGDKARKKTSLWLKNLPKLKPTNIVEPEIITYISKNGNKSTFSKDYCQGLGPDRSNKRSKTYPGIAIAMAEQWTNEIIY